MSLLYYPTHPIQLQQNLEDDTFSQDSHVAGKINHLPCGLNKGHSKKKKSQMVGATFIDRQGQTHGARCVQLWIHSTEPPGTTLLQELDYFYSRCSIICLQHKV